MPERLRIEDDVAQLPAAAWQQLASGHPALRLEVLQSFAATARDAMALRFFMLEDESGIAAAAVSEVIGPHVPQGALDSMLFGRALWLTARLGLSSQPVLLFRTPVGTECPLLLRAGVPAQRQRNLCSLLDQIGRHAANHGMGIAFLPVHDDDAVLRSALEARRYVRTHAHSSARLHVEWASFDTYLARLQTQSPSSARTVRQERHRSRRSGVRIRDVAGTDADAQALYRFARDHYRHKNGTELPFDARFLPQLAAALGPDFLAFEALRDGQRVGMLGGVRSGTVGWMAWYGAESQRPRDFTYANLVFYHPAEAAGRLGLTTLLYGTHAADAKRRRGCQILGSHLYYRPHRPLARVLAAAYFRIHRAWYRRKFV